MPFTENASVPSGEDDPQRAPIFEPQGEWLANQRDIGDFEVCGSFDPMQPRDRQAIAHEHPLIAGDRVSDAPQDDVVVRQVAGPSQLLDEFEGCMLHVFILPTIP